MLKLIIGMAIDGYRYDPRARRGSAVIDIVHDLEKRGVPLSDDTVRKIWSKARRSSPGRELVPRALRRLSGLPLCRANDDDLRKISAGEFRSLEWAGQLGRAGRPPRFPSELNRGMPSTPV